MTTISGHRVRIPGLGKVVFPSSMNINEVREASENLHQRDAAIRLSLALDRFDGSTSAQNEIYQRIIQFRKTAKNMHDEDRAEIERSIAAYSNGLAKK